MEKVRATLPNVDCQRFDIEIGRGSPQKVGRLYLKVAPRKEKLPECLEKGVSELNDLWLCKAHFLSHMEHAPTG